ncbi:MAG: DUF3618 domain-containing protein [Syntrophotaleaceae bacterium]
MNGRDEQEERARRELREEDFVRTSESVGDLSRKSTSELEGEIRTIRSEMDETLRALERRFSPGELLDRAIHRLPGGPKEFANNLGSALRDNPLPATLTGIGIAWLMASSGSSRYRAPRIHRSGSAGRKIRDARQAVSEKFHQVGEQVQGKIAQARESMHERGSSVGEKMGTARERAGEIGHRVQDRGRHMKSGMVDMSHEHPILMAGVGLAVGALVGALIPSTRREDRLMGEARDTALEHAKEKGREQMETAEAALQAGKEAAREETERRLH